jgi:hypothetical protein
MDFLHFSFIHLNDGLPRQNARRDVNLLCPPRGRGAARASRRPRARAPPRGRAVVFRVRK